MFLPFSLPLPVSELVRRTLKAFDDDNCWGLAAQLSYYLLLGLVPALIFLVSLTSYFPPSVFQGMLEAGASMAPGEIMGVITDQATAIMGRDQGGLLTLAFATALWSSSAAVVSLIDALNRANDIEEQRPWWKVRLVAMGLTIALALLIAVAFALVLIGPEVADWIAGRTPFGSAFEWTWVLARWPIAFVLVTFGLGLLNYFGPDADQDWTWITPGAVAATLLWLVASIGVRVYLTNVADYNATYGSLGGVMALMLWFYISGAAILFGAEMNAEIEHASPWGAARGAQLPGQRRVIGSRAARAGS